MLASITIIAILTAAAVASFNGVRQQGWRTRDRATAQQIAQAWNVYVQEERKWPEGLTSDGEWTQKGEKGYATTEKNLYAIAPYQRGGNGNWTAESGHSVYLELSGEDLDRGRDLGGSSGGLFDHWKNRFLFRLDEDFDGKVVNPNPRTLTDDTKAYITSISIAWSTCGSTNPDKWAICW